MNDLPNIMNAFLCIALDNNGINRFRSSDQQKQEATDYLKRVSSSYDLNAIDAWLGDLSPEDFDTFVIGEESESLTVSLNNNAPEGVQELMDDYFNTVC